MLTLVCQFVSVHVNLIHPVKELVSSLASLGPIAWIRLGEDNVRFTIMPEQGTQVWAVVAIDSIFGDDYMVQSNADNAINLEVPLAPFVKAIRSALPAHTVSIRLTKKFERPLLSLSIHRNTIISKSGISALSTSAAVRAAEDIFDAPTLHRNVDPPTTFDVDSTDTVDLKVTTTSETTITQDVPVRVLAPSAVIGLHEPRCPDPDVHIILPSLAQLKAVSDRFTRLASGMNSSVSANTATAKVCTSISSHYRLELAANMHGCLRLRAQSDAVEIQSVWTGLVNPELDPSAIDGGEEALAQHPSTRMKLLGDSQGLESQGWATVTIDGRDWSKVMSVGRLGGRVIAC